MKTPLSLILSCIFMLASTHQGMAEDPNIKDLKLLKDHAMITREMPVVTLNPVKGMEVNDETIQAIVEKKALVPAIDITKAHIVIESMEDASKHLTRASIERIDGIVDFDTQKLVVFAWQGSGADTMYGLVERATKHQVHFRREAKPAKKPSDQTALFVIPKEAKICFILDRPRRAIGPAPGELKR